MAERRAGSRLFRITLILIVLVAMGVGLPLTLLGLMALLGAVIENLWICLVAAIAIALIFPLLLADRLLPHGEELDEATRERSKGLVGEILALCWAAGALTFLALSSGSTGALLQREAARLEAQGWSRAAFMSAWMAGPQAPTEAPTLASAESPEPTQQPEPSDPSGDPEASKVDAKTPETDAKPDAGSESPKTDEKAEDETGEQTDAQPDEGSPELSPAEVFTAYAPSVVAIKIASSGGRESGGTGFFIDRHGTIATNHHVIDGADRVQVKLIDGRVIEQVELLTSDENIDLALLQIDASKLDSAPAPTLLGDSSKVTVGETVVVIGNPLGLEHTLSDGLVSARRVYEGKKYIQMSAPISPGNSGGPVFDHHGRVIGVSVAFMWGGQNLNLAVPVAELQAMIKPNYPERRRFGSSSW